MLSTSSKRRTERGDNLNSKVIYFPELRGLMASKGITISELSSSTGIKKSTLSNKLNGVTEFNISEVQKISYVLNIENIEEYFFNNEFEITD